MSRLGILIAAVVAVVLLSGGIFGFLQYRKLYQELTDLKSDAQVAPDEATKLIETIGKLIALPEGEQPTIATVTEVDKLKSQPFFANAQNGDKVLVYTQAKKAILYRPSLNKIIEVAPVNTATEAASQIQISPTLTPPPASPGVYRLAIYNGTNTSGLANIAESKLKKKLGSQIEVVAKDYAENRDYKETIVVDLTGNTSAFVEAVAELLHASVSKMPPAEDKPDADILIIIGSVEETTPTPTAAITQTEEK